MRHTGGNQPGGDRSGGTVEVRLHAQAFPSFGSERTGAPVVAFCRIGDREIRTREPVTRPHALIVQDATLLHQVDVFAGLRDDGWVIVNSRRTPGQLGIDGLAAGHVITLPASVIAREHVGRPLPNAALLGGLAALTGIVGLDAVLGAIEAKFAPDVAAGNVAAARAAYDVVLRQVTAGAVAPGAVGSGVGPGSQEV